MESISPDRLHQALYNLLLAELDNWDQSHILSLPKTAPTRKDMIRTLKQEKERYVYLLQAGNYYEQIGEVIEKAESQGLDIRDNTIATRQFAHEYYQVQTHLAEILIHRLNGDYDYEVDALERIKKRAALKRPNLDIIQTKGIRLSELIHSYGKEKERTGEWGERSQIDIPRMLNNLVFILGDIPVDALSYENMREFKEKLSMMPANRPGNKKYEGRTVDELMRLDEKKVSPRTVNNILTVIGGLFDYAVRHGYIDRNYIQGMKVKINSRQDEERLIFDENDLEKIFSSLSFHGDIVNIERCCICLLALYTGARLEEITQLGIEDIKKEDNIYIININDDGDKRVKSPSAKRNIPIHPSLLEIHIFSVLRDLAITRENDDTRIFKSLKKVQSRYGHSFSKWFSNYKTKLGLDNKKTFHSFRHTFINAMKQAGCNPQAIKELAGHAKDDITADRYGKPFSTVMLYNEISKINFDIPSLNFNAIAIRGTV
jgi:integrase